MTELYVFYFSLADISCQISTKSKHISRLLNKYYHNKVTPEKIEITISVNIDQKKPFIIKTENKSGYISFPKHESFDIICFFLKFILQSLFINRGVLLLHGSSFVKNGRAYVFYGPSGIGKSTIIKKVKKRFVLSDDTTVLKKRGRQLYVFPSFFERKFIPHKLSGQIPLGGIFILKQASETVITRLRFPTSFETLLSNTFLFQHLYFHKNKGQLNLQKNQIKNSVLKLKESVCLLILQLLTIADIMILENKKGDDIFKKVEKLLWKKG